MKKSDRASRSSSTGDGIRKNAPLLLGVDLGTSSVKTVIIDAQGRMLACVTQEYGIITPQPGWAEQNPLTWELSAQETMRRALVEAGAKPHQIATIGLSGQMHGTVCLDQRGQYLRPAIIWADQRSADEVAYVYREVGFEQLGRWTANPLATGFMLATWLWLRSHEPELYRTAARLLLPKDYLRYRLTDQYGSESSDASSTLLFDTVQRGWSRELLDRFGIDPALLPPIHESADIAGGLNAAAAAATGLLQGTPVVFGGSDQALQAIGNGIVEPGIVSSTIGTGGQLFAPTRKPAYDSQLRLHLFCHALPECWHLEAATLSAGLSLRWMRDNVFEGRSYQELADAAAQVAPGAQGLFFLPDLAGERTPHMDPTARGGFFGLALSHQRGHLVRALMEGVVFELRQGLDLMRDLGIAVERVVASGGGTRHPLWLQLQADILNCPIYQTRTVEAAAVGAALLAGVGVGIYDDVQDACHRVVHWQDAVVRPVEENVVFYDRAYQTFCRLYSAQKSVMG